MHRFTTFDFMANILFWLFILTGLLFGLWLANRRFSHLDKGTVMSLLTGGAVGGILGGLLFFLAFLFLPWLGGDEQGTSPLNFITNPLLCLFPLIGLFLGWWLVKSKSISSGNDAPIPPLIIYCGWGIVVGIVVSLLFFLCFLLIGIGGGGAATPTPLSVVTLTPTQVVTPTLTITPTKLPTLTATPTPTATLRAADIPTPTPTLTPTATLIPAKAIEITDELAADGCPIVELNPDAWSPPHAVFNEGSDPFFHIYTKEEDFYVSVELYTQYGAGWTGQLGVFAPNCNRNGICVYLVPDAENPYLATDGEVEIITLPDPEEIGVITSTIPIEIGLSNLTLQPVPGTSSPGCFHVDELFFDVFLDVADPN